MKSRPSSVLFYVLLSLVAIFGLYIVGGFILNEQQQDSMESMAFQPPQSQLPPSSFS